MKDIFDEIKERADKFGQGSVEDHLVGMREYAIGVGPPNSSQWDRDRVLSVGAQAVLAMSAMDGAAAARQAELEEKARQLWSVAQAAGLKCIHFSSTEVLICNPTNFEYRSTVSVHPGREPNASELIVLAGCLKRLADNQ